MNIISTVLNNNFYRHSIYRSENNDSDCAIFLLGALQDIESVDSFSQHFAKTLTVVTIEVPGTGRTQPIESTISIAEQTQMLLDMLHHLNINQAHVIGFSYATAISVELCSQWQGVQSLSICGGVPGIPKSGRLATKKMISASMISSDEFAESFTNNLTVQNIDIPRNRAIIRATKSNIKNMPQERLDIFFENSVRLLVHTPNKFDINVPTTICVGEFDPYVTKEAAKEFAEQIKNSHFLVVKNADHLIHLQYPNKVAEILISQAKHNIDLRNNINALS